MALMKQSMCPLCPSSCHLEKSLVGGVLMLFQACSMDRTAGICRVTCGQRWPFHCGIELEPLSCSLSLLSIHEQCFPINLWYLLNRCLISCILLGWEPFIEPWPCSVSWQQQAASRLHPPRLKLEAKAKPRLDINLTSVLIGEQKAACCRLNIYL